MVINYNIWGGALPHQEIIKCAGKNKADLIVMGSHTKKSDGKWYAGSAVERTGFRANCPVIVVTDPEALLAWDESVLSESQIGKDKDRLIHVFSRHAHLLSAGVAIACMTFPTSRAGIASGGTASRRSDSVMTSAKTGAATSLP